MIGNKDKVTELEQKNEILQVQLNASEQRLTMKDQECRSESRRIQQLQDIIENLSRALNK